MREKDKLKRFLITRFLMILLFVAVSELLLNMFYNKVIYPGLSEFLQLDMFLTKLSVGEALTTFGKGIIWVMGHEILGKNPLGIKLEIGDFIDSWAGQNIVGQLMSQTLGMSGAEQRMYLMGIASIFLILMLILLLPYLLAAFGYGRMVAAKVAELEQEEKCRREEFDKRRNLLLSDVAHDLKTPMTTVTGYASALSEGRVTEQEKQQEYLDVIYHKSMQMNELITLLFEYVKLDSEGFSLKKTREDINEILRESVAFLYTDFEEKEMKLEVVIPEEAIYLSVDRIQFQRAVNNLLNNAIKHNPKGTKAGVFVEKANAYLEIRICDNGSAIPKETAAYIFDPFVMGDESRTGRNGSGLGLSIVQKIIYMHGGEIILRQDIEGVYEKAFIIKMKIEEE